MLNSKDIEKIPRFLLFIDFEKASDTLEWSFIEKTLKHCNFGDSLILWIRLFYTDMIGVPLRSKCPDIEMLFQKPKISRDVQNMMPKVITYRPRPKRV